MGTTFTMDPVGAAAGVVSGIVGGLTARKQQQRAHKYNLEYMEKQNEYNKEMQERQQQYSYDMWDYTNYENQRKHMEAAGLNPALVYGMSGVGGQSASGADGAGGGLPANNPAETGMQGFGMAMNTALQAAKLKSEIKLNEEKAREAGAGADKTAGVDTELTEVMTKVEDKKRELMDSEIVLNEDHARAFFAEYQKLWQETQGLMVDNEIKGKTKDEKIKQIEIQTINDGLELFEKSSRIALNQTQKDLMTIQMVWYAYEQQTKRMTAEAAQNRAGAMWEMTRQYGDLKTRELDQRDTTILQEWIKTGFSAFESLTRSGSNIADIASQFITRGTGKTISETIKTLKDANGNTTTIKQQHHGEGGREESAKQWRKMMDWLKYLEEGGK